MESFVLLLASIVQSGTAIVGDVLLFLAFSSALAVGLVIAIARLPADNPLRRILHAVSLRVAAFLGAGAVAIPVQPIPGIDIAYDVVVPALLIWSLVTMFREIGAIMDARASAVTARPIEIQAHNVTDQAPPVRRDRLLSERKDKASPRLPD